MDSLTEILKIGGGMGVAIAVLVGLAKAGLLQVKIGRNGQINEKIEIKTVLEKLPGLIKELPVIKEQLETITDNHLHDISTKLDKLIEINQEQLFILKDLKNEKLRT